ncbi:MAG TPA: FkbM family methyltransferase, partial [Burkholderiales bacterium]|nr:FkbM family methyltransferase [Burkholderiales bacterium]
WVTPYAQVDRNRYLRRLKRGRFPDSRYVPAEDRAQFVNDEVVVRVDDAGVASYFHCHPRSSVEDAFIKRGFFQKPVFDTLVPFVRPGSLVIDVGANLGAYAIPLARRFPDVEVHAFEPNPPVIARLEENIALNRMRNRNVAVRPLALSDAPGRLRLHAVARIEDNFGLSSLREDSLAGVDSVVTEVEVETLDRLYLMSQRPVSVIKIDVQGHELQVLRGGRALLARFGPVLVFEHEDRLFHAGAEAEGVKRALSGFLEGLGYRCYYISRYGADLLTRVAWDRPLNGDVLAVPFAASTVT